MIQAMEFKVDLATWVIVAGGVPQGRCTPGHGRRKCLALACTVASGVPITNYPTTSCEICPRFSGVF
jgi:hypothetical protein